MCLRLCLRTETLPDRCICVSASCPLSVEGSKSGCRGQTSQHNSAMLYGLTAAPAGVQSVYTERGNTQQGSGFESEFGADSAYFHGSTETWHKITFCFQNYTLETFSLQFFEKLDPPIDSLQLWSSPNISATLNSRLSWVRQHSTSYQLTSRPAGTTITDPHMFSIPVVPLPH